MPFDRRQLLRLASLLPVAVFARISAGAAAVEAKSSDGKRPPFFVKGIWQQPLEKMVIWKERGINTMFAVNGGGNAIEWTKEAIRQELYVVREPLGIDFSSPNPSFLILDRDAFDSDLRESRLLAFALMDEPSNLKPGGKGVTYEDVSLRPDEIDAIARDWSVGGKPLWINHIGNHINNVYLDEIMSDYADSPDVDWLSHDCYPIASGDELVLELDGYASTHQGHAIDRMFEWSDGKPQFSFVGLTQYNGAVGRETTPAEFRAQVWSSIIHGVAGIIYFSFKFSPQFSYDATPPELASELAVVHSQIDETSHILMDTVRGGRRPSRLFKSVRDTDVAGESGLPYPFEGCEITTADGEYKIILNLSNDAAELTYPSWDLSGIRFGPHQCRRGYVATELMAE